MDDVKRMAVEGTPQPTKPEPSDETQTAKKEIITSVIVEQAEARRAAYARGKRSVDEKATANQEWWRGRHWSQIKRDNKTMDDAQKPASAWLFNSIINKHADIMDNFPKPNVLPRTREDQEDAEILSKILPVVLEQNGYQQIYSRKSYDYIGDGTAITGVFWDNQKNNGMGDIAIKQIDIHNIFWKPGIENIQDSPEVFTVAAIDNNELIKMFPQMEGKVGNTKTTVKYKNDDKYDDTEMSEVVDWYYKVMEYEEVVMDEVGTTLPRPKTILHYCKYCNGEVLYSSENEGLDKGFYHHGKFPFVFQTLFPIKDSPAGFGYIDVMKDPQKYIDVMDQLLSDNALKVGTNRYFVKESLGVDVDKFADLNETFIPFTGNLADALLPVEVPTIPAFVLQYESNKIEELKETSGNRDFSQGSAAQGVTAASAIAALQEAGSKLSRDMIRGAHVAFQEESYFSIELFRQFYTEPRSFRIDDGKGGYDFEDYDNSNIAGDSENNGMRPIFDLQVVAEKKSPFSRAAQNETAKEMYSMGLFNPDMAEPALICLDMMDFEGKDDIKKKVQDNSILMQQVQQMAGAIQAFDATYPEFGLAQAAGMAPMGMPAPQPEGGEGPQPRGKMQGTPEERAAQNKGEAANVAKARQRVANQTSVG